MRVFQSTKTLVVETLVTNKILEFLGMPMQFAESPIFGWLQQPTKTLDFFSEVHSNTPCLHVSPGCTQNLGGDFLQKKTSATDKKKNVENPIRRVKSHSFLLLKENFLPILSTFKEENPQEKRYLVEKPWEGFCCAFQGTFLVEKAFACIKSFQLSVED